MAAPVESSQLYADLQAAASHAPRDTVQATLTMLKLSEQSQLEAALAARLLRAVTRVFERSPERMLADAISAGTDVGLLLRLLTQADALLDQEQETDSRDPLLPTHLAGIEAQRQLLELGGGVYTAMQAAEALGISRQAVDNRRKRGTLLALTLSRRGNVYPAWQIFQGRVLDGLDVVLAEMQDTDPWAQTAFMLNPNTWLNDETPLHVLQHGRIEQVRDPARMIGEHVAA